MEDYYCETTSELVSDVDTTNQTINFGVVEWIILSSYLLLIIGLGAFFAYKKRQEKNQKNAFFQADHKIPSWVVALSLWSTILTTITFLATPINAYNFGWVFAFSQLTLIFVAPFVVKKLVPFFRIIKSSSAYGYLESRFNYTIRAICSALFIFFNLARIGITLFLAINAISIIIPINIYALITIVGVFSIILTLTGGMTGIVYSDAIQALIRIGGMIVIIIFALVNTNSENVAAPFINIDSVGITLINTSIWVIFVSNLIITVWNYVGSQDVVRRYKSIPDPRKIRNSIILSAVLGTLSLLIFFGLGSALYTFYNGTPINQINPKVIKYGTQLLPYFIFTVLPGALAAFILGSILTSAQVNISSGISSSSNSIIVDFIQKFWPKMPEKKVLLLTKLIIILSGIISIGIAIIFALINFEDIISIFLSITGLFGGAPAAVVLLGMFTKRVSSKATLIGLISGLMIGVPLFIISQSLVFEKPLLFGLWPIIISFATTTIVSYSLSFVWPNKKDITNFSWKTIDSKFKEFIELEKRIYSWKIFKKKNKVTELETNRYLELKKEILNISE